MGSSAIIVGNGGHSRVMASILKDAFSSILFVDKMPSNASNVIAQETFFREIDTYKKHTIFLGIGNDVVRKEIYNRLLLFDIKPAKCIASNVFVAYDAELLDGVTICPGAVVNSGAVIGANTIINTLSSIDHDCFLGNHSQVTVGVSIAGTVKIGESCFFGTKSAVIPNIKIGANTKLAAGSVLFKDAPADVLLAGNPAVVVKSYK